MDKSLARANEIIDMHIRNIEEFAHDNLLSVVLVGSISDGSYIGNAGSDIDLIHIIKDNQLPELRTDIFHIIDKTLQMSNNDIPISRCVYKYADLFRPFNIDFELTLHNKDYLELPIEIFRMKDSGITIFGENIISKIDTPTREERKMFEELSKKFNLQISKAYPEAHRKHLETLCNPSLRIITQSVLTSAMNDYFYATNQSCSNKANIARKISESLHNYPFQRLLDLATKYRYNPNMVTPDEEGFIQSEFQIWRKRNYP
jgi:predicted nucleotidyltransferase